jgi:thymidylate synthase
MNSGEKQYTDAVRDIINTGSVKTDRTGTGTISKFGLQMRYNLSNDVFPLLTTKRVFWRGVAEELFWLVSGSTDTTVLAEKGVHFWDANTSREFLDKEGFTNRKVGDLGPGYGFQWRHFGAEYDNCHTCYDGKGVDQLAECERKIKETPDDRRIIVSAWNPSDLKEMSLPPCHMFYQFYVTPSKNESERGTLSCQMYQRSADMGLGVPFNIASYALLTKMMAQTCNLNCGEFIHSIGDAHIYLNHVDALKVQIEREPRAFPMLKLNPSITKLNDFRLEHCEIIGYNPYPNVKMEMAV